ncbi:MAG: hypothetical protein DMG06_13475 [Acidobacteria bacterium]|nr:MAG: hypothetical protein DMG06_13475 [Acidobacteriota bacterium]
MSRIYDALRRAEREGQNLIQRTQIGPVILEQSKTETREPRILQKSIIQKFQSQESSPSRCFEPAEGQDLFGEDVAAKAGKLARCRPDQEEQNLLRPLGNSTISTGDRSWMDSYPLHRQPTQPRDPVLTRVGPAFQFVPSFLSHLLSHTKRLVRRPLLAPSTGLLRVKSQSSHREILAHSDSTREEEIKLVQRVFLAPGREPRRTVIFSGVEHGNGCSRICAGAGETLAEQATGSVCIVDANLRSPSLHKYFGLDNSRGLTEAIFQSDPLMNYAQQLPAGNIWVLTGGSVPPDPRRLLNSDGLRARMAELRAVFDFVVIDAPPVSPYTDATFLGQLADGIVLVVEANSTRREIARKAVESLGAAGVPVLAAVLNKRTFPVPKSIYRML